MLHDARNLLGAIGLYCDLLAMPGVLKPEHSNYPEELRHLGARSGALIDALMRSLLTQQGVAGDLPGAPMRLAGGESPSQGKTELAKDFAIVPEPVSLRHVLEGCSGLLSRVADGRRLEVQLGPAADATVRVPEEAVERILVNLIRNAAAALEYCGPGQGAGYGIRITLGMLTSRVGAARPWPFQRVRLSVEDAGCGMSPAQVAALMDGSLKASGSTHGIGFRVVRELTTASDGDLQIVSSIGSGTRVQIEWPVAAMSVREPGETSLLASTSTPGCSDLLSMRPGVSHGRMEASC